MAKRVALLRGINVGGHRVKMDVLRELFVDNGYRDVATFIASGNVIYSSGSGSAVAEEREIEDFLEDALGYAVPTFVRDIPELRRVASVPPFDEREYADPRWTLHVMFLKEPAEAEAREALAPLESGHDTFRFDGREAYWLTRGKMSESPLFAGALAKATGGLAHTMRSVRSVGKLLAKHG